MYWYGNKCVYMSISYQQEFQNKLLFFLLYLLLNQNLKTHLIVLTQKTINQSIQIVQDKTVSDSIVVLGFMSYRLS